MKIRAKRTFVSGRWSASEGDVIDVPTMKAEKLISIGFAEASGASKRSKASGAAAAAPPGPATTADGETPAPGEAPSESAEKPAKAKAGGKRGKKAG